MSTVDGDYLRDPRYVRAQYSSEKGLADRASLYSETSGPFAGDVAFAAIAVGTAPRRVLDVGCGTGWFAARVKEQHGCGVIAVDQSERMVELARAAGVDARVADLQELPFGPDEFDCVAANWMLYHVRDIDLGLSEIVRVLRPGGTLVAITNGQDHLLEVWQLLGADDARLARDVSFNAENGDEILRRHFSDVEMLDASGTVTIRDAAALRRYIGSMEAWRHLAERVPPLDAPLVARRSNVVFVATT